MMDHLKNLKFEPEGIPIYAAGLPNFSRNFTRDSIISGILMKDSDMLRNQLEFCALHQGMTKDPKTGEEPGKMFHEFPGVWNGDYSTKYNASDATALYLIGHRVYQELSQDNSLIQKHQDNIKRALDYSLTHIKDNLFIESPEFCGAKAFALPVTYWKDSQITGRSRGVPIYPVIYSVVQAQYIDALRSTAQ